MCVCQCVCARAFYTQTSRLLYDLPAKVLKSLDEPMMTAKAYCGRVITEWLSHELVLATRGLLRGDLETRWVCVTVTATQAYMVNREGLVYARGYLKLAEMLQRNGKNYFIIRPKLDALGHMLKQMRETRCGGPT